MLNLDQLDEVYSNLDIPRNITRRELQILYFITLGSSNRRISEILFITIGTVKTHVRNMLYKFNLYSRVQLAIYALKTKLVTLDSINIEDLYIELNFLHIPHTYNYNYSNRVYIGSEQFTSRQIDVIKAIAKGYSNIQIANTLYLSLSGVKVSIRWLMYKLEFNNRICFIIYALKHDLISIDDIQITEAKALVKSRLMK